MSLRRGDALVVVDAQRDFLPGGALAIPGGDEIVAPLNRYLALFASLGLPRFATRDWHPPGHVSFHASGGPWPEHCVAGTPGAEFAPGLVLAGGTQLVSKAGTFDRDAYSAFDRTDLHKRLAAQHVTRIFVGGLATELCVAGTVRDALALGYEVVVLADAVRALDAADGARALADLAARGARAATWTQLA